MTNENKNEKLVSLIISNLSDSPAYLFLFGIILLFCLFAIGTGATAIINQDNELFIYTFIFFGVAFISSIILVMVIEVRSSKKTTPEEGFRIMTGEGALDESLNAILDNIKKGITFENNVLNKRMVDSVNIWRAKSGDWGIGQFVAKPEEYQSVLISIYENAQNDIFSTSELEYDNAWNKELGKQIIRAHEKSGAHVKRVFVFNSRSELNESIIGIMKKQNSNTKISIYSFFDNEVAYNFHPDLSKDFTIIDGGELIGITSFGDEGFSARWHVNDLNKKNAFLEIKNNLIHNSEYFSETHKKYEAGKKLE